ncbi:MAG: hypothetical protein TREMPRED_005575 [Tremellales sp. Tagirdzhanova-0007]|nr:MAG: hypothetical protein TREMPRED_005575 [Tremellales sp. Tagirdzhanova-0007]
MSTPADTPEAPESPIFQIIHPSSSSIQILGRHFIDPHGRILDLRGVNVGAGSKSPQVAPPLHQHRHSSYVGRPFPLDEAADHWRRLRSWGLTFVRLNVTWEALEHAGPGMYDQEYLNYLRALLLSMTEYGIVAYIGIHQDVFSRYCGGKSGAPGWTLEAAGFDLSDDGEKLVLSGSAFLDGIRGGRLQGERGLWPTGVHPQMVTFAYLWMKGYQKLACATMNTLFWGGTTFMPSSMVLSGGKAVNIQQYLQDAFLAAVAKLVEAVNDIESVVGFELMNEPHPGFIGLSSIHAWNYNTDLHLGQFPTPLQSFSMGAGHPTPNVAHYVRSFPWPTRRSHTVTGNPTSACAWSDGQCPWEKAGVWCWSEVKSQAIALQEDYFAQDRKGRKVNFYQDFYFPFVRRWDEVVGKKGKGKARMVGAVPNEYCPSWPENERPSKFVYAPHWYDLNALFKKQFGFMTINVQGLSRGMIIYNALYWGRGVKKNYSLQVRNIVQGARQKLGEVPILIGECGVPMDLNNEEAFQTGNFTWHERMMDSVICAFETNMVGFNLWTYNPLSRDDIGDDWNAEHFSWYSNQNRDAALISSTSSEIKQDLDAGARLLNVIVRPYAVATAGTPISVSFDPNTSIYTHRFRSPLRLRDTNPSLAEVTEIFLPRRWYKEGDIEWLASSGGRIQFDWERERVWVWFVDAPRPDEKPRPDRVRRFDIWVPSKVKSKQMTMPSFVAMASLVVVIGLAIAWYLQNLQWEMERKRGIN